MSELPPAYTMMREIMDMLRPLLDEGTSIDTGLGSDGGDMWLKIGGIEWLLTVRKSNNQLAKEGWRWDDDEGRMIAPDDA